MTRGHLFVISGPSGAGKGTLVARLVSELDGIWLSVSATTRKPREGEVGGVHYFFYDPEEFEELIEEDGFIEWARYAGNCYGTPRAAVEEHLANGEDVILEIEVQGALQIKEKIPEAILIFIEPPSHSVLEERLRGRGTDSEESIIRRLKTAEQELLLKEEYDYCFVNDDLDTAVEELKAFVSSVRETTE